MAAQELVDALDAKHGKDWTLWRTPGDSWVIQIRGDSQTDHISGTTLDEALLAAAAFRRLPTIPRRPKLHSRSSYSIKRDGSKWHLCINGDSALCNLKTKREAEEAIERFFLRETHWQRAWDEKYGAMVARSVEGVDFRYEP